MVAKDVYCVKLLAARTLTNLCNQRPIWLALAHQKIDETVFAADGWPPDLRDEEILAQLLALLRFGNGSPALLCDVPLPPRTHTRLTTLNQ